jgi:hypothetical protein
MGLLLQETDELETDRPKIQAAYNKSISIRVLWLKAAQPLGEADRCFAA